MLDSKRITKELNRLGSRGWLTVHGTVASTNDEVRALAAEGAPHGTAVLADSQTSGRGRGSHRWHSPAGQNVYLSVLFRPAKSAPAMSALTLAIGVGVLSVVDDTLGGARARIKWPNDVYVDGKKIAGILVESTIQGDRPPVVVVGVGLNVLTRVFPPHLADTATSLAEADPDRDRVAAHLIHHVRESYDSYMRDGLAQVLPTLRARDYLRGREVTVSDVTGVAEGIDENGRLLVGGRSVASGEVVIHA